MSAILQAAEKVRQAITQTGLSKRQVALQSGLHHSVVSNLLDGRFAAMEVGSILALEQLAARGAADTVKLGRRKAA